LIALSLRDALSISKQLPAYFRHGVHPNLGGFFWQPNPRVIALPPFNPRWICYDYDYYYGLCRWLLYWGRWFLYWDGYTPCDDSVSAENKSRDTTNTLKAFSLEFNNLDTTSI
jgi:hypothetical protein